MKKLFSCVMALLAAACLYATELNVYASGLKVHQTSAGATIDYMLNAPATSLNVYIYGPENTVTPAKTIDLSTDAANLTKGAHAGVTIDLSGLADAVYTWAIEAGQTTVVDALTMVNDPDNDPAFQYYLPQDVAVDNNFESPYFGRVYVSESTIGQSDGGSATTKKQNRGIYIYNSDLTFTNGQDSALIGYDGKIGGNNLGRQAFKRLAIDNEGVVYVASRDAANMGIYRMNPANPSADFECIHAASSTVDALGFVGNTLVTLEGVTDATTAGYFNIYDMSNPLGTPTTSIDALASYKIANPDCDIAPDGRGGWWICQHRYSIDAYPVLNHVKGDGTRDYKIDNVDNTSLLTRVNTASYRGVVAVNPAGNLVAICNDKKVSVFSVEYDALTDVPTLTLLYKTGTIGGNIDGIAFDVASNLYVASASVERFYAFATPKDAGENIFKTPAPASEYIALPCVDQLYEIGDNQGWATDAGVAMTKVATNVFEGEFTFANATSYFTLAAALGTSASDWGPVNASRYGASEPDEAIADGDVKALHLTWENSFSIPAGRYKLTADLNAMTVTVEELVPIVSIAGLSDWSVSTNILEDASDHLTASKTIHLNAGWYQFKVVLNGTAWFTDHNAPATSDEEAALTEMNRANSTGWVFDKGDGYKNTGLRVDLDGDYEFVYTYATQELSVSGFPTSFTRTVSAEDADKYQTLCVPFDATISGAAAYAFDGATETGVILNAVAADALEAGKSYLILPEGAGDIVISAIPAGNVVGAPEDLHGLSGFYGILGADYNYVYASNNFATYVLQNDNKFHKIIGEASATITSTHAYLHVQDGIAAPELRIIMGATNIENVEGNEEAVKFMQNGQIFIKQNGVVYDAMGAVVK